jgi:hypothetical protein
MTSFAADPHLLHPSSGSQHGTAGYDARHPQPSTMPVPTSSSSSSGTAPTAATSVTLYVVQKCWLDGPRYAQPIDCGRLWTSSDAATQFAHASATQYASIVQHKKLNNSGRINTSPTVRTLLLDNRQYGFATSGRLFWVRAVQVPLCPCYSGEYPRTMTAALTASTTALVRLHHGVVGGTEAGAGRRGTEDVLDCARLDCPKSCLQSWISAQLRCHQACSWLRIPVGNAQRSSSSNNNNSSTDWWKEEWSDWESWGGSAEAATSAGSALHHANAVASTLGGASSHHKRRCSWSDHGAMEDDGGDDIVEEEDSAMRMGGHESPSRWGTRGRLVTEDHHHHPHHHHNPNHQQQQQQQQGQNGPPATSWFAPGDVVDYAPNKRAVLPSASLSETSTNNTAVGANALGRELVDSEMMRG